MKKIIFALLAVLICAQAAMAEPLNIVTTQTIFAELVREIGGEHVSTRAIALPKFNVHFYAPKPSDIAAVKSADLYVSAGLDLEEWSDPLLEAAGKPALMRGQSRYVDLSRGIALLHVPQSAPSRAQGHIHLFGNPHFHMNPVHFKIMAKTLADKLSQVDPANAQSYENNTSSFIQRLEQKIQEWKKACSHCAGQEVISYHSDMAYFADFLGLKSEQFIEPKPGIPPTAKHLQFLEDYARERHVKVIALSTYYPAAQAQKLSRRVGMQVVTICQSAGEVPGTEGIFEFFDYNVRQIREALQ